LFEVNDIEARRVLMRCKHNAIQRHSRIVQIADKFFEKAAELQT
jgi:hypothetical protein